MNIVYIGTLFNFNLSHFFVKIASFGLTRMKVSSVILLEYEREHYDLGFEFHGAVFARISNAHFV